MCQSLKVKQKNLPGLEVACVCAEVFLAWYPLGLTSRAILPDSWFPPSFPASESSGSMDDEGAWVEGDDAGAERPGPSKTGEVQAGSLHCELCGRTPGKAGSELQISPTYLGTPAIKIARVLDVRFLSVFSLFLYLD